jgi:hypothetical protein
VSLQKTSFHEFSLKDNSKVGDFLPKGHIVARQFAPMFGRQPNSKYKFPSKHWGESAITDVMFWQNITHLIPRFECLKTGKQ